MVIQEIPQQDVQNALPPGLGSISVAPEALKPAFKFAPAFSRNSGFAPTSILIEIFGALTEPAAAASITSGTLLGLAGIEAFEPTHSKALLESIMTTKCTLLNSWIEVPFIAAEHLILTPSALSPSHFAVPFRRHSPDGLPLRPSLYHSPVLRFGCRAA